MNVNSSATVDSGPPILPSGLWWGVLGVLAFSLTVLLTRIARLLKEHVTLPTLFSGLLVIACATTAVRARNTPPRFHPVLEAIP